MEPNLLDYDPGRQIEADAYTSGMLPREEYDPDCPLAALVALLRARWDERGGWVYGRPPGCFPYYVLMKYRDIAPEFFPPHDLCLLMANIMLRCMAGHEGGPVALLDWGLLPAAIWLAAATGTKGRTFFLPPEGEERREADLLIEDLEQLLPGTVWRRNPGEDGELPPDAWVLACDPLAHGVRDPKFLSRLEAMAGGVFLCGWGFLGVRIHAHTRSLWLKAGLIDSVLQLPRPRRQSAAEYPAILTLRPPAPDRPIRLARVSDCGSGPGGLDQAACLSLLDGAPGSADTVELEPRESARDGLFNLTPTAWLTPAISTSSGRTLRSFAQVLRCQLPRKRLTEEELGWFEELGQEPDAPFVAREISLSELDPMTGFVDEYRGNRVKVALTRLGKQGKYLLQANDIVFAFRGSALSVGQVGFVEEEGEPAITGQSLCIIRALPDMNPIWLYYYLKRDRVVRFIRSKAIGSSLLTVNLESIRDIPMELPGREELEFITQEHRKISENMARVAQLHRELHGSVMRIWEEGHAREQVRQMRDESVREPEPHGIGGARGG
ncbi:MAG: restriction endonuclease subunit S [Desulfovibrionaceae bacterium]|nr:restriction endonuclease subunit S [Desulfovibrionaceae bacterium]